MIQTANWYTNKMKRMYLRGMSLFVAVLLLSGVFAPLASAADADPDGAFNVVVSPPSVGITTNPGAPITTPIRVQNQGLGTEHVKVSLMRFGAKGQDGTPQLYDLTPADDFAKWVTFSTPKFDAEPNVWKTVNVTINPPKTAAFGYYYAVIFSRDNVGPAAPKTANLLGSVASLVLLDVNSPGAVRQAKISEFSTKSKVQEFCLPTLRLGYITPAILIQHHGAISL